jgi:hypothetical protein
VNRNTVLFVALVLLLLAGPLLWIVTDETPPARVAAPPAPPAAAPPPVALAPAKDRAAAKAESGAPAGSDVPSPPRAPAARVSTVVLVTLAGTESGAPADTYVKLSIVPEPNVRRGPSPEPIALREGPEPVFQIDATDLFAGFVPGLSLDVRIDRAGFLPARVVQRVQRLTSVEGRPAVVQVTVELVLAGEAEGVVQDDHSRPVAHAAVGSFALLGGKLDPVDATSTDDDGRFRVRLRPGDVHVVAAAARDRLPSSAQVLGVAGAAAPVTGLILYEGHAISGRVRVAVAGPRPPLRVVAFPSAEGAPFQLGDDFFEYRGAQVLRRPGTAAIQDDGTYRVAGLAPEEHVVALDGPEMLAEVADATAVTATAPAQGVDLSLAATWSVVRVKDAKGALAQATVALRPIGKNAERSRAWTWDDSPPSAAQDTDDLGVARFLAPEGARYSIAVTAEGHAAERRAATTPFDQTIEAAVVPDTALALQLDVDEDADGAKTFPSRLELRLFDLSDVKPWPAAVLRAAVDGTTCTVHGLPTGSFRVEVRARPPGWFLLATTDVKLSWQQTTGAAVKLVRGGRVRVEIRGAEGAPAAGTYRVLDAAGVEHAAATVSAANDGSEALVAAGDYRVVVTPLDGDAATVPVSVEASKTVRVQVGR